MRVYCPKCQALRDTVYRCVEIMGRAAARFVQVCAVCSVALAPIGDEPHTHQESEPLSVPRIERVIATSTGTSLGPTVGTTSG
jgi:hypothetical protein